MSGEERRGWMVSLNFWDLLFHVYSRSLACYSCIPSPRGTNESGEGGSEARVA